jgi:hypothetical protein
MKPETKKRKAAEKKAREQAAWIEYNKRADYCESIAQIAYDKAYYVANRDYSRLKRMGIDPTPVYREYAPKTRLPPEGSSGSTSWSPRAA